MQSLPKPDQPDTSENALLAKLPAVEWARLAENLELVDLPAGHVLHDAGETMSHAYFPTDCVVSLRYIVENGSSAEVAVVGNEGMIGIALFTGAESTISRAVLKSAGQAYRLKASALKAEFDHGGSFSQLLLGFSASMITQMVQGAALSRHLSPMAPCGAFTSANSVRDTTTTITS